MFNLSTVLEHHARNSSNKEALIFADKRITFAQLDAVANQIANGLTSLGIGYGDKVALTCPNLPYFPMIYFGILKTGASVVPLSVLLKRHEIAYHLQDSDAKAYFCFVGTPESLAIVAEYARIMGAQLSMVSPASQGQGLKVSLRFALQPSVG